MKYKIESLSYQMIKAKKDGVIDFREMFKTKDFWAQYNSNVTIEFDDRFPNLITFIHEDANGKMLKKEFNLPDSLTYNHVLDVLRPYFDKGKSKLK